MVPDRAEPGPAREWRVSTVASNVLATVRAPPPRAATGGAPSACCCPRSGARPPCPTATCTDATAAPVGKGSNPWPTPTLPLRRPVPNAELESLKARVEQLEKQNAALKKEKASIERVKTRHAHDLKDIREERTTLS